MAPQAKLTKPVTCKNVFDKLASSNKQSTNIGSVYYVNTVFIAMCVGLFVYTSGLPTVHSVFDWDQKSKHVSNIPFMTKK
jgi:hypothetical protein